MKIYLLVYSYPLILLGYSRPDHLRIGEISSYTASEVVHLLEMTVPRPMSTLYLPPFSYTNSPLTVVLVNDLPSRLFYTINSIYNTYIPNIYNSFLFSLGTVDH